MAAATARAEPADEGPGASLLAGYAFRSVADGRQHGVAALLSGETPSWGALALRLDGLALFIPGSTQDEPGTIARDLTLAGGALSLTYRFDESDIAAHLGLGPLAAYAVDGDHGAAFAGALVAVGLRFVAIAGVDVEARLSLPIALFSEQSLVSPGQRALDDGTPLPWPLQVTFCLGAHFDPLVWLADPVAPQPKNSDAP